MHLQIFALLLLSFLAGCAASHQGSLVESSWVWIQTGPEDASVQGEARSTAFAGHFSNMDRMAEEGDLLLAGPLGEAEHRPEHRGIFVLRTRDLERARTIAGTDPTAMAGVFQFEIEPFRSADGLDRLNDWHAAAVAASGEVDPPPGFHCRTYVLAEGDPAGAADAIAEASGVLFSGRIGQGEQERLLLCLDAEDAEAAAKLLPRDPAVSWSFIPWYGTEEVQRLRDPLTGNSR